MAALVVRITGDLVGVQASARIEQPEGWNPTDRFLRKLEVSGRFACSFGLARSLHFRLFSREDHD
jgi:hypothetical protein